MHDDTPDLDAELAAMIAADEDKRQAEALWREHPENTQFEGGGAWGLVLHHLSDPPGEDFGVDFPISVGVCGLDYGPDYHPDDHADYVVLSIDGSNGTRLTNFVLTADDARQLARSLEGAAEHVDSA